MFNTLVVGLTIGAIVFIGLIALRQIPARRVMPGIPAAPSLSRLPVSASVAPTPAPIGPVSTWKDYSSTDPVFSIRYPAGWEFHEWRGVEEIATKRHEVAYVDFGDPSVRTALGTVLPRVRLSFSTDDDLATISVQEFSLQTPEQTTYLGAGMQPKWTEFSTPGHRWAVVYHYQCQSGNCLDAYLKNGNTIFRIGIPDADYQAWPDYFRQMLASFTMEE